MSTSTTLNFESLGNVVTLAGRFVGVFILVIFAFGPILQILETVAVRWGFLLPDWATLGGYAVVAAVVTVGYRGSIDDLTVFCVLTFAGTLVVGFVFGSFHVESSWLAIGREFALFVGVVSLAAAVAFRSDWRAVFRSDEST
ncbi:hypothetical protein [Natronoglomus mannanivorans]|uniref:Uncharacterized protein n=1 Tax=Natronoglomus mannanivorans TaxID=2979990 RepID=A0AAP2Z0Y0_9EURY|nr:hypothetical protein [Halobacteria archaeon AArc-xg1-1]